ncbi:HD-GYP domain-containing protein [Paenibacillus sp.]|uniref:HD-GYP domain-containing protein n=1 Tax=Paenibacillus sp. TaxID=58172 RepID=UPI002D6DB4C0|nr:HD domain-containing phosphohydrolase [Paenibacillus sp.]HZG88373.1 HD domain-containing phosphohydrolase [Paenibacillus sp.]
MNLADILDTRLAVELIWAAAAAGGLLLICVAAAWYIAKVRAGVKKLEAVYEWLDKIRAQPNFDQKMSVVLEGVSAQFEAQTYALYIRNERYDKLMLRASRFRGGKAAANANAFLKSEGDVYKPGATAEKRFLTEGIDIVKEGEVPLLVLPISSKGVIRLGPVLRISRRAKRKLKRWMDFVRPMVEEVIEAEQVKEQAHIAMASKNAIVNLSKIALEENEALAQILPFCLNTLKAAGGCLVDATQPRCRVASSAGAAADVAAKLADDAAALEAFRGRGAAGKVQDVEGDLPAAMLDAGMKHVLYVSFGSHYYLFWFKTMQERYWKLLFLQTLAQNYEQFARAQKSYLRGSGAYVPLLQALARLLDDLSPNTIGYSELMSRYSIIIARQLGLPDDVIRDVAVAAYLSHIGTIALSSDLFQKEGQYTEAEFELMKLHAEVSALIVSFATGNERTASYIRHHHERMDGHGYPAGLKGTDIPIGSRIIAVVQLFLAKVNGRNYRDPLTFDQTLQMLRSAGGQQLDPDMVQAFLDWYTSKRRAQVDSPKSLGACSEMCCVPESICSSCPAFGRADVNCWETEGVLCAAHGKSCDSCFVKTEAMTRRNVIAAGART